MAQYFTERTVQGSAGSVLILTLVGEDLDDPEVAEECGRELSQYVPRSAVLMDFQQAPTVRSAVIAATIALFKATRRIGHGLCLYNAGPGVMDLLTSAKIDQLLVIRDTEEEAMEAVSELGGEPEG